MEGGFCANYASRQLRSVSRKCSAPSKIDTTMPQRRDEREILLSSSRHECEGTHNRALTLALSDHISFVVLKRLFSDTEKRGAE